MSSRVHDSEVEQVTRRSVGLAWWSADAGSSEAEVIKVTIAHFPGSGDTLRLSVTAA